MAVSLKLAHVPRYKSIATLLVKHWRAEGLKNFDPTAPAEDDPAMAADAHQLADDLESMGPTFIQLGQLLSTRADLLPPAYPDALSRLQDNVEPIPFETIEQTVTDQIGARMSNLFQEFGSAPAASASLGQVHKATLRNGLQVAVKVQ